MIRAYIDGACEPTNPGGTSSYGVIIEQPGGDGLAVTKLSGIVGTGKWMSNNVAEYSALLAFLTWYIKNGSGEPAEVYSDSALLVNQATGKWTAHRGMYIGYYQKAMALIRDNDLVDLIKFVWVPREENRRADWLSKRVLKEAGVKVRKW